MDKFIIDGGEKLYGKVEIQSAKNTVLPLLAASVLTDEQLLVLLNSKPKGNSSWCYSVSRPDGSCTVVLYTRNTKYCEKTGWFMFIAWWRRRFLLAGAPKKLGFWRNSCVE